VALLGARVMVVYVTLAALALRWAGVCIGLRDTAALRGWA
jgi:hypothetical protein